MQDFDGKGDEDKIDVPNGKEPSVADRIIGRLRGFAEALESGKPIAERFTMRNFSLHLQPDEYDGDKVKQTRQLVGLSQALFALYLGVSVKTLQSWEQGKKVPTIARRFMDEVRRDPKRVIERLAEPAPA